MKRQPIQSLLVIGEDSQGQRLSAVYMPGHNLPDYIVPNRSWWGIPQHNGRLYEQREYWE